MRTIAPEALTAAHDAQEAGTGQVQGNTREGRERGASGAVRTGAGVGCVGEGVKQ